MDTHRRLLSILHIIYGTVSLLLFVLASTLLNSILPFIEEEISKDNGGVMFLSFIFSIVRIFFFVIAIAVPLPSIIGGIALYNNKKWGLIPLMISGCVSLISFPLGTVLGVYTIWSYLQLNKPTTDD